MNTSSIHAATARALGPIPLVYFGIRGGDASAFEELDQLSAVVSITDQYAGRADVNSVSAEAISGVRIDLDGPVNLDEEAVAALDAALDSALTQRCALVIYRPNRHVTNAVLRAGDRCKYLGMFDQHQAAFEFKPWVDQQVSALGVPTLEWRPIRTADRLLIQEMLSDGPLVVRLPVSSGGAGVARVDSVDDFDNFVDGLGAETVSISRYIGGAIPLNVGAVVWADATVTMHPLSVQLVGVPELLARPFGYCGNDFGVVDSLEQPVIQAVDIQTRQIGRWLRQQGYLGAFGIDYLLADGRVLFCELNPRFQGSSRLSDRISKRIGIPGLAVEHLAAFLGVPAPPERKLSDLSIESPGEAQAIFHNRRRDRRCNLSTAIATASSHASHRSIEVVCPPQITCAQGGVLFRLVLRSPITTDGYNLRADIATMAAEVSTATEI